MNLLATGDVLNLNAPTGFENLQNISFGNIVYLDCCSGRFLLHAGIGWYQMDHLRWRQGQD